MAAHGRSPGPGDRFAAHFRLHVVPVLETEILRLATDMAAERPPEHAPGFAEALLHLMSLARRRGASYLPQPAYDSLEEWAATALLDAVLLADEAAELVERLRHEPDRTVMREAIDEFAARRKTTDG